MIVTIMALSYFLAEWSRLSQSEALITTNVKLTIHYYVGEGQFVSEFGSSLLMVKRRCPVHKARIIP